ncbi:YdcF family protein [Sphaerospermopsis aphanizomenoides BCCUSP55]|uniref:YdcF family protein n=1 Tax=Sphaerospermopsis aphanizomenoides TaxID=459663 RepID=UPI000A402514|nr:YdcF family protein [Sphaerospermopsis aphanizomenoides]MBK1986138.1 YdcF family protein [Sphaerospermopsis aphanizomenoides BCCUSP55]
MKSSRKGAKAQRYHQFTKNKLVLGILSLISALVVMIASTATSIYFYGDNYTPLQADAAIVLGAAVWGKQPSPVFRERINHSINLYQRGYVRALIFTGGVGSGDELAEAVVGQYYAVKKGVKSSHILMETTSRTTYQNLQNASEVVANYPYKTFLIVSDPLHLKRAVLMARDLGLDAQPSPTPTTRYQSLNSQLPFLMRETYFYFVYLLFKI